MSTKHIYILFVVGELQRGQDIFSRVVRSFMSEPYCGLPQGSSLLTVSGTDTKLLCQAVIKRVQPVGSYMQEWKPPKSSSDSAAVNTVAGEYYS